MSKGLHYQPELESDICPGCGFLGEIVAVVESGRIHKRRCARCLFHDLPKEDQDRMIEALNKEKP